MPFYVDVSKEQEFAKSQYCILGGIQYGQTRDVLNCKIIIET